MTIGQAFDLAYRRFLENSGREVEGRKQISQMKGKIDNLERQNEILRRRLLELSNLVENSKLTGYLNSEGVIQSSYYIKKKTTLFFESCWGLIGEISSH